MRIRKLISILAMVALLTSAFVACQPNIHPEDKPGASETIGPEKSSIRYTFTATERWSVVNDNDWMYVTPSAGLPGEAVITVHFEENSTMKGRAGAFYVIDGANTVMYSFTQPSVDIISTDNEMYYVPEEGGFVVRVRSNVDYTVTADVDWVTLPSSTSFKGEGAEEEIAFGVKANTKTTSRSGHLAFATADGKMLSVSVIQAAHVEVDWTRDFYKGVLGYRFTGDWCGFCPNLAYDVTRFNTEEPGRLNCICFYDANSVSRLRFNESSRYEKRFSVTGKPTLTLDERGFAFSVASPTFYQIIKAFCEEEKTSYKAQTAVSAQVLYSNGKVEVHPTVFVKEAGTYHLHVALMENGVVAAQTDYTNLYTASELENFEHGNVVRSYATKLLTGDEFSASEHSINAFNYTMEIPATVLDKNRLSVVVYVTRQTVSGPQAVEKLNYYRDHTEFVDNSVIVPVGQNVTLKYETK